jgi:hypothetical protein
MSHNYLMIEIRRMTLDAGLQLCIRHSFKYLQIIYVQMGAYSSRTDLLALESTVALQTSEVERKIRRLLSKFMPAQVSHGSFQRPRNHGEGYLLMTLSLENCSVDEAFPIAGGRSHCQKDQSNGQIQHKLSDDLQRIQRQRQGYNDLTSSFFNLQLHHGSQDASSDVLEASTSSICSSQPPTPQFNGQHVPSTTILDEIDDWEMIDESS